MRRTDSGVPTDRKERAQEKVGWYLRLGFYVLQPLRPYAFGVIPEKGKRATHVPELVWLAAPLYPSILIMIPTSGIQCFNPVEVHTNTRIVPNRESSHPQSIHPSIHPFVIRHSSSSKWEAMGSGGRTEGRKEHATTSFLHIPPYGIRRSTAYRGI